jgi:hypothetical protein
MDSTDTTDHSPGRNAASSPGDNQVDLAGLLAAHEKRRLNQQEEESSSNEDDTSSCPSSCSESLLSTPDDDDYDDERLLLGVGSPRNDDPSVQLLRINPNFSSDKVTGMTDVYTRQYLFTLPALFLAVVRGNATLVYLLLKYGATVNFQVRFAELYLVETSYIVDCDLLNYDTIKLRKFQRNLPLPRPEFKFLDMKWSRASFFAVLRIHVLAYIMQKKSHLSTCHTSISGPAPSGGRVQVEAKWAAK